MTKANLKVVEPGPGHNSDGELTEAERRALLVNGLAEIEQRVIEKDAAVGKIRTARKRLVANGFKPKVIDFALRLRKDDDDEMIELRKAEIEVARFLNHPIGHQADIFDQPDRTPDVDKARAAGEIAGAAGVPRSPPYSTGSPQEQAWLDGYATGQTTLASAFKKLETIAATEPDDDGEGEDE